MKLKFDMAKPYFDEIKNCNSQIERQLKKNRKNEYIQEIKNSINSNKDILKQFPVYFKKVLFPITYERFIGIEKKNSNSYGRGETPAINKWFGNKGWKNIATFMDDELIKSLRQEHIDLIPDLDKKKVAQDFFDYSRVFTAESKENRIRVPMHIRTKLYDFNWVQIRDMNKNYKSTLSMYYGNSSNREDKTYINYIYPKNTIDGIINEGLVEYDATENTIKILFYREDEDVVEEIFVSRNTINNNSQNEDNNIDLFLSNKLMNWDDFNQYFKGKLHEIFLDDIENLLTPEIKKTINMFIAKQETIKNDWTNLQEKYAKNLLFKGNI